MHSTVYRCQSFIVAVHTVAFYFSYAVVVDYKTFYATMKTSVIKEIAGDIFISARLYWVSIIYVKQIHPSTSHRPLRFQAHPQILCQSQPLRFRKLLCTWFPVHRPSQLHPPRHKLTQLPPCRICQPL